jgi:hypothetical protein
MSAVILALVVGGIALLFSGLVFLICVRGSHPKPGESFEESQERLQKYLREMRRDN